MTIHGGLDRLGSFETPPVLDRGVVCIFAASPSQPKPGGGLYTANTQVSYRNLLPSLTRRLNPSARALL